MLHKKLIVLGIHLFAFSLTIISCSHTPPRVYFGGALGAGLGTALGHQVDGTDQSRIIGAVLGAGIGSLIAYTAGNQSTKENSSSSLKSTEEEYPALSRPKLRSVWVPDKIEGNKYIKGHQIYIIEEPGSWKKE